MTRSRVAVTGLGLVSPFGSDPALAFDRLMTGRSAIRPFTPEPSLLSAPVPAVYCDDFDAEAALGRTTASLTDRYAQLGIAAALDAWRDAGLPCETPAPERPRGAVCWGTGLGGTRSIEQDYFDLLQRGRRRA